MISSHGAKVLEYSALPKQAQVPDVGAGTGFVATFLATPGLNVLTGEPKTDTKCYGGKGGRDSAATVGVAEKIDCQFLNADAIPFSD